MRSRNLQIACSLLCLLLLTGCVRFPRVVHLSDQSIKDNAEELTAVVTPEDLALLEALTELKSADFSGSSCYEEIRAWAAAHPGVTVRYTVELPDGQTVDSGVGQLDLSGMSSVQQEQTAELLPYLPQLEYIRFGRETPTDPALLQAFRSQRPELRMDYTVSALGRSLACDTRVLDLTGLEHGDVRGLIHVLPWLPALRLVELGSEESSPELGWKDLEALIGTRPDVSFRYAFRLYDREFSTQDETMDFSHVKMQDQGEAVREVLPCMQKLQTLDMDSCGVDNEIMAEIRDQYPEVNVVWRVWFGDLFSCRTDAVKILASLAGTGGALTPENTQALKYCTKIKYLDVGHNPLLTDISFLSYMPDLEVAILAMDYWTDASPIADCPHLEFLEIQTTKVTDLTPLKDLKELRHLNIGYNFDLTDMSPIMDLDLERLWIGAVTPIPEEQVEEYQRRHPDCEVNLIGTDPHYMWRWIGIDKEGAPIRHPRYDLLVDQFGYDRGEYSFEWIENRGW